MSSFQKEIRCLKEKNRAFEEELAQNKVQTAQNQAKYATIKLENDDLRRLLNISTPDRPRLAPVFSNAESEKLKEENERLRHLMADSQRRREELETALAAAAKAYEDLKLQPEKPRANSKNSGLSPSHDFSNQTRGEDGKDPQERSGKKPKGGQKGHKPHFRNPFTDEEGDEIIVHQLKEGYRCTECNEALEREPNLDKQDDFIELSPQKIRKIINKTYAYKCSKCGKVHYREPPGV
jgi:DNA-directed RNA polymerase subunit RPC12/RpoP